jgi:hypothetical protein
MDFLAVNSKKPPMCQVEGSEGISLIDETFWSEHITGGLAVNKAASQEDTAQQ